MTLHLPLPSHLVKFLRLNSLAHLFFFIPFPPRFDNNFKKPKPLCGAPFPTRLVRQPQHISLQDFEDHQLRPFCRVDVYHEVCPVIGPVLLFLFSSLWCLCLSCCLGWCRIPCGGVPGLRGLPVLLPRPFYLLCKTQERQLENAMSIQADATQKSSQPSLTLMFVSVFLMETSATVRKPNQANQSID